MNEFNTKLQETINNILQNKTKEKAKDACDQRGLVIESLIIGTINVSFSLADPAENEKQPAHA